MAYVYWSANAGYTVDIINYLNANGINFIMRAKGKFKEGDDLIYELTNHIYWHVPAF